ncbi:SOS response-associated peptidase [Candidatus Odyssella thessalonicensis]|uniref:SOS response-associated peptidase n=1 Tax=Candidatus Odyssella thessalonicensis TaxID=84647 RepID=UPI000225AC11|nr:SOS response-associated peptidase [Candidatus Odyssella thessalonicensis]
MCGRFTLAADTSLFKKQFPISTTLDFSLKRYNIAPSQSVPIIHLQDGNLSLTPMSWGLLPRWEAGVPPVRPINARLETLTFKPMFKRLFDQRRCLVPATGFYEWDGRIKPKQPYYFTTPGTALFAFAGLWDKKQDTDGQDFYSFAIITRPASSSVSEIHDRMPVILKPEAYEAWLKDPSFRLLEHSSIEEFQYYPVSPRLNLVVNNDPDLIKPY